MLEDELLEDELLEDELELPGVGFPPPPPHAQSATVIKSGKAERIGAPNIIHYHYFLVCSAAESTRFQKNFCGLLHSLFSRLKKYKEEGKKDAKCPPPGRANHTHQQSHAPGPDSIQSLATPGPILSLALRSRSAVRTPSSTTG